MLAYRSDGGVFQFLIGNLQTGEGDGAQRDGLGFNPS